MPTINRFRIVNFRYDNDKKYIANQLFEFGGQNALINLENGGGKSVILQLALQALIPGAEMSGRKFVDYFKVNSGTVHILIEWISDSTVKEYLLTGICASRDSEGLRYFTYTHAYNSPNECDIKRIPVVNSKKQVTGYSEFYKFLRSMTSEYRINTYSKDRMGDYRRKLAENSLFREEYDAIIQINQSEGGIEKFFERARKSRNVIERLIIPAIPSLAGEEQNILAGTFKKHLENLKSIPLLQYNIGVYHSFIEKGKELLELLADFEKNAEVCTELKGQIKIFENILFVVGQRVKEEQERLEKEKAALRETEQELKFKIDSLEIFLEEGKKLKLEEKSRTLANTLEVERLRLDDIVRKIKYANSANSYIDLKEQRKLHLELKEKLGILNVQEGELQQEYQDCLFALSQNIIQEIQKLQISIEGLVAEEKENTAKLNEAKEQIKDKRKQKEKESNSLAVKRSEKERAGAEYDKYASRFNSRDMTLLLNPEAALGSFEVEAAGLEKNKIELKAAIENLIIREEDTKIKTANIRIDRKTLDERLLSRNQVWEDYEKKARSIKGEAEALGMEDGLYSGTLEVKLAALTEKIAFDLAGAQVNHNAIENKKLLLDGLDYYLPDKEILAVYRYLEENGVVCMPGSLWIKKQPEDKRQMLLRQNPLLPYAIIIETSMLDKVLEHSEAMSKLAENYPVAIITGNDSGLSYSEVDLKAQADSNGACLDILKGSEVYLLSSANKGLLINEKELEAFIAGLGKRLEKASDHIASLKEDHQKIIGLKERVAEFLKEYSFNWKEQLSEVIRQLTEKVGNLGNESEKLEREQEDLRKRKLDLENDLSDTDSKLEEAKLDISGMKEIIKAQSTIAEASKSIGLSEADMKVLDEAISGLEQLMEELSLKLNQLQSKKGELSREEDKLNKRLREIKSEQAVDKASKVIQAGLEELEARLKAIKDRSSMGEREGILKTKQSVEGFIEKYEKIIKNNGFDEADFDQVYERFPDTEILSLEEAEHDARETVKENEEELRRVQGDINLLSGGINKLSGAVLRNYGKEHYEFNSGESTDQKFYEERRKELDNKLRKLNLKMDEVTSRKSEIEKQLDTLQQFIEDRKIEAPKDMQGDMLQLKGFEESIGLWDIIKMKTGEIAVLFKRYRDRYKEVENELDSTCVRVEKNFDGLYSNEEWKDNATVRRILSGIMKEDLYNIQNMRELFGRLFESVRRMKEAEELHLEECKRNKGELVERCLHRAQTVYDELKLVDSFSKIKIGGQNLKIIKIDIPKLEEEQGRSLMAIYLEKCIDEISSLKEERTYDPAKIDNIISGFMAPQVLLDAVIKLNDISISVYKPEHNMELSQYIPWEVVIQWSGGEKLAGFFAMFISIVTYLRYKKTGWQGSTKVIWIDNPFGQANAGHLLEYIFELAKATNTQMICLTGLQETNIYAQFDVVYSLVHRMLSSMSIIQSKQVKAGQSVEVGYYNLNSEQMSLF